MKKYCVIIGLALMLTLGMDSAWAQFIQNSSRSLFSDVKAFKEGDALMILITEFTEADNKASNSEDRSTDLSGSASISTGNSSNTKIGAGLGTGNRFKGSGATTRSERIKSKLSARVIEVEENGNLKIEGKRTTKINGETQTIIIQGIVRPVDISPQNSVYSFNILDLTLFIEGDGSVSKTTEPGLITKFLRLLF
ncbi:MAG: flagellar basal body L-ring protein FlgH [Ignavibacteria bacterium]|nr:flagellar basal body L-ring protein FlgH [Ignavibacteria bacterium]